MHLGLSHVIPSYPLLVIYLYIYIHYIYIRRCIWKPKFNINTKNDGLENRSPFKYGFWVSGVYQKKDARVLEFHHSQLKCSNSLAFPLFLTGMLAPLKPASFSSKFLFYQNRAKLTEMVRKQAETWLEKLGHCSTATTCHCGRCFSNIFHQVILLSLEFTGPKTINMQCNSKNKRSPEA